MAYVGASAFSHKGGLHVSAVKKDPKTYEHIDPELIGNHRNIIVSNQAGRSNILSRLEKYGVKIDSNNPKVQKILDEVKDREFSGYTYDGADASFELLANRLLGKLPEYLKVKSYNVSVAKSDTIKTKANVVFLIDEWTPYYIEGLPLGEISIKLELVNNDGVLIETPFTPSERTVILE